MSFFHFFRRIASTIVNQKGYDRVKWNKRSKRRRNIEMNYEINMHTNDIVVIRLFGELDHHEAERIRTDISRTILQGNLQTIIWNLERLNFMDSSGIGLILGRMRELTAVNGQTIILNPSNTMKKIFQFSGLGNFMFEGTEEEAILSARGIVNG